ncbi:hypothetical protein Q3G72_011627 [Acer saccharum]|nr:hypothetical protein Q3G72_011627 [Acer saccharum]
MPLEKLAMKHHRLALEEGRIDIDQWKGHSLGSLSTQWKAKYDHIYSSWERSFYVDTSSQEEGLSIQQCCTFRDSFCKLDVETGKILWKTFMLPYNNGKTGAYAGAAFWGSSPSIDIHRNHVYIATGNLYSAPPHIEESSCTATLISSPFSSPSCCFLNLSCEMSI